MGMKNNSDNTKRMVLGTMAALGFSSGALAQPESSVTIFGLLDLGVVSVKNSGVGRQTSLGHSNTGPSRLGFEGRESLGGGSYASFRLEAQVQPDVGGSNAKFWNRQATVGIGNNQWGELRLGRDTPPSYRITTMYDPFTANGIAADVNITTAGPNPNNSPSTLKIRTYSQADNLVSYFLPPAERNGGVSGQFSVAPSEGGSNDGYAGGYLSWKDKSFSVGAHVSRTRPGPVGVVKDYRNSGIGASYEFASQTKLMALVQDERFKRTSGIDYRDRWYLLGLVQYVGQGGDEIRLSYIHRNTSGSAAESANDGSLRAAGYIHKLSKRTSVYAMYAEMRNQGRGTYYLTNSPASITPGGSSKGLDIGIKHLF